MTVKLSIIIPFYGVEDFLRETLESVIAQKLTDYEVLMINDGSPDNSREIAVEFEQAYPEFKLIDQENAGLGAARNNGMKLATGKYVIFLDSDDVVPAHAYEKLLATIETTGSKITTGNVRRFNVSRGQYVSKVHAQAFQSTKLKTNLAECPELIYDSTSWNKIYELAFLEQYELTFAEGVLYEDIPLTARAYMVADSVDMLEDVVYLWRAREGASMSITQSRSSLVNLTDRAFVMNIVKNYIHEQNLSKEFEIIFDKKMLSFDFMIYLNSYLTGDDEYKTGMLTVLNDYLVGVNPEVLESLSTRQRVVYGLVKHNKVEELTEYYEAAQLDEVTYNFENGKLTGYHSEILKETIVAGDLPIEIAIENAEWVNDTQLHITGFSYLYATQMNEASKVKMRARAVDVNKQPVGEFIDIAPQYRDDLTINLVSDKTNANYDYAGFDFSLDFAKYATSEQTLFVEFTTIVDGIERTTLMSNPVAGNRTHPVPSVTNQIAYFIKYSDNHSLRIHVLPIQTKLMAFTAKKKNIVLGLQIQGIDKPMLIATNTGTGEVLTAEVTAKNEASFPKANFAGTKKRGAWKLEIVSSSDSVNLQIVNRVSVIVSEHLLFKMLGITNTNQIQLNVMQGSFDGGRFAVGAVRPLVTDVKITWLKKLRVTFDLLNNYMKGRTITRRELLLDDGQTVISVPLKIVKQNDTLTTYRFDITLKNLNQLKMPEVDVRLESEAQDTSRIYVARLNWLYEQFKAVDFGDKQVLASLVRRQRKFAIDLQPTWAKDEDTEVKRAEIAKNEYPKYRELPLEEKTIVFDSLWSGFYNDSPRAMSEYIQANYPEYKVVWFLKNTRLALPAGIKKVRPESKEYWYYLATAKYLVQNTNFADEYIKRDGQVEMETLHGTFLKSMGFDEPQFREGSEKKRREFQTRINRWDYMVSPSPYMDKIATNAYHYEGEVVHAGFPRNDELYTHNTPEYVNGIKQKLNIPAGKKILLYTPTFRNRGSVALMMDLKEMQAKLSDEWIVLIRAHYFVASKLQLTGMGGFAYNVSLYPDINDLFLVADVQMTDYSSVMFDYAHLQRPMIFFAYDLARYEEEREIYLDYKQDIPGPMVTTTEEIIDKLENFDQLTTEYQDKITQFYEDYATYGRGGKATELAVKKLLGKD